MVECRDNIKRMTRNIDLFKESLANGVKFSDNEWLQIEYGGECGWVLMSATFIIKMCDGSIKSLSKDIDGGLVENFCKVKSDIEKDSQIDKFVLTLFNYERTRSDLNYIYYTWIYELDHIINYNVRQKFWDEFTEKIQYKSRETFCCPWRFGNEREVKVDKDGDYQRVFEYLQRIF